jgi:TctA family transporter
MPLLIGFLLGPLLDENVQRALLIGRGSFAIFVGRPLSTALFAAALLIVASAFWVWIRQNYGPNRKVEVA